MAEKKNPDYSASAARLMEPLDPNYVHLSILISLLASEQIAEAEATTTLQNTPEYQGWKKASDAVVSRRNEIECYIRNFGGLQAPEAGIYALIQLKKSFIYTRTDEVVIIKTGKEKSLCQSKD